MLALTAITSVTSAIVTLGSGGAVPRLSLQEGVWAPSSAAGSRAIVLHHLLTSERRWVQMPGLRVPPESLTTANLAPEPPRCKPDSRGSIRPCCLILLPPATPRRLCPGRCVPQSPSSALLVLASPSQLCEPSLRIWFVSSWQCHPPKCHGTHTSMKTREPGHVVLFVCMCPRFQRLRNVRLRRLRVCYSFRITFSPYNRRLILSF